MFNFFNKSKATNGQAVNHFPVGSDNRPEIANNSDFEKLFSEVQHPKHHEADETNANIQSLKSKTSIKYNPTPEAGVRYPDMGPFAKREIFKHDARKMIYNRGRRYAMAYIASEIARNLQIEFLISEYSAIMDTLIVGMKEEIAKKLAVFNSGNDLVKEQLQPVIDELNNKLKDMEENLYLAGENKGEVEHALKAFNRGWDLGVMRVIRNVDLQEDAMNEIDLREEGGEL